MKYKGHPVSDSTIVLALRRMFGIHLHDWEHISTQRVDIDAREPYMRFIYTYQCTVCGEARQDSLETTILW